MSEYGPLGMIQRLACTQCLVASYSIRNAKRFCLTFSPLTLVTGGHPGLTYVFNFWHSGTLALRAERRPWRTNTNLRLYCVWPAELLSGRNRPIRTYPASIWRPRLGWSRCNFMKIFGIGKLESLGYRVALSIWSYSHICTTPTCDRRTDWRTDRQTHDDS